MKTLESWLKSRRKVLAIEMVRSHSKANVTAMEQLSRCIDYATTGNMEELKRSFSVLQQKEKEADELKRKIIAELAKGDLPPTEREDLMRLARSIDQVIDWINETGRILVEFDLKSVPGEIKSLVEEMVGVIHSCVVKLDESVEHLSERRFADALKAADEVERLEEQMDELYGRGRNQMNKLTVSVIEIGPAILLGQFIDSLENITDRSESTADEVRIISVLAPI